jgi:o-succinylbenzoate---CoA ligase
MYYNYTTKLAINVLNFVKNTLLMLFFDFTNLELPVSENSYFQKVISFVKNWQNGIEIIKISTSGSTGIPKIIELKRSQMLASANLTADTFQLFEGTKALCCLNIDYIGGMMMLVRAIELKWQLTVIEPVGNPFLEKDIRKQYDFAAFVPLQMQAILENIETKKYLINSAKLKTIIIGGASTNSFLKNEIEKVNIPIFATYGMTETVSHIALMPLNGLPKSDYFNKLKGVNLKIDERNCLKIKAKCTDNQWIQTNDLVELKECGFKLLGRANRVVNSGGVKIYLDIAEQEIEDDLISYFKFRPRFFLFGMPDEQLGEKLALVIEAENPKIVVNGKEIFKNSILSKYKLPKIVFFLPQFIDTESAKIDFIKTKNLVLEIDNKPKN